MSLVRSKRSRTHIDYSKFGREEDINDDDDFADSTPPPGKKPKKSTAPKPKNTVKSAKESQSTNSNQRKHVTDRSFDRDLQLALELSKKQSGICSEVKNVSTGYVTSSQDSDFGPGGESLVVTAEIEGDVSVSDCNQSVNAGVENIRKETKPNIGIVEDPDAIEVLGHDVVVLDEKSGSSSRKRQAATKAAKSWSPVDDDDADDEFIPVQGTRRPKDKVHDEDLKEIVSEPESWNSPSESEESWKDSDDDSDFDVGKRQKSKVKTKKDTTTKSAIKKKMPTKPKSKVEDTFLDGIKISEPVAQKTSTPISKPAVSKNVSTSKVKTKATAQKENDVVSKSSPLDTNTAGSSSGPKRPLGMGIPRKSTSASPLVSTDSTRYCFSASGGVKSPSGGLRLGLSKKARIKPLHASVNISH